MTADLARPRRLRNETPWLSTAFVVVALVLLAAAPIFVSYRVRHLRRDRVDVSEQARVLVNDLEAAFVTQLYVREEVTRLAPARADSIRRDARAREMADERQLDSLVRLIGPEAVERFVEFRTAARAWRISLTRAASDSMRDEPTPYLLAAAEGLDTYLTNVSEATRARIRVYERAEVVSAMILFPLALAAIGIVFWSSHRLAGLVRAVEKERMALARSIEARTALIHGVTHDVKNPLGAAKGYAELLEEGIGGPLSSEQISMLRRVRRLVDVALGTVAELLDVARSDAGQLKLDHSAVDIGKIAEELVVDYHGTAAEKRIELRLVPLDGAIVVETDALRVRRILGNLLSNALKYTPSGGRVTVSVNHVERVEVSVQDSGPGVAKEDRERIFDEFFRAPGVEGVTSGAGLGLAISRRFARALGGDIVLDGASAEGACFTLWLPAHPGGERQSSG